MSKPILIVAMVVAVCTGCASKQKQAKLTGSCVGDAKYAQVTITLEHDNEGRPKGVKDVPPVTIYMKPDPTIPSQKGQVCWVIEPKDARGNPRSLAASLILTSKDGTPAFGTWTTKQKMPGDPPYMASGLPIEKHPGWAYGLDYGSISVDPVIIIIDESH